eukprot:gnl/TRDRNA2_/TRDRNA2_43381_c0_seq1.p1 gnl/TRDRNA2_/TRDRNA2_43381_c0~~gnl/TRDRNA2_/TRDRNA2_43381_c0_seq1.p1  ORF type:complete len:1283 (-),score=225.61 gnl/TRDRNA2_/TRDRNA2_43381_c0_seq1:110-3508(-)
MGREGHCIAAFNCKAPGSNRPAELHYVIGGHSAPVPPAQVKKLFSRQTSPETATASRTASRRSSPELQPLDISAERRNSRQDTSLERRNSNADFSSRRPSLMGRSSQVFRSQDSEEATLPKLKYHEQGMSAFRVVHAQDPFQGTSLDATVSQMNTGTSVADDHNVRRRSHCNGVDDPLPLPRPKPDELCAEWQVAHQDLPYKLSACTACVLNGGSRLVIFGGLDLDTDEVNNRVHILDWGSGGAGEWSELSLSDGPPPSFEHVACSVDGGRAMIVHGGRSENKDDAKLLDSLKVLEAGGSEIRWQPARPEDNVTWERRESLRWLTASPSRRAHTFCVEEGNAKRAHMFGGYAVQPDERGEMKTAICSTLNVFDMERCIWLQVDSAGSLPLARAYHTAVTMGPYMAVFGGIDQSGKTLKDLRLLHLPTLVWTSPELAGKLKPPPKEQEMTLAAPKRSRIQFEELGNDSKALLQLPGSEEREASSGGKTSHRGSAQDLSGTSQRGSLRGRSVSPTEENLHEPEPRSRHAAVPLTVGTKPGESAMLIFGGRGANGQVLYDVNRLVFKTPMETPDGSTAHSNLAINFMLAQFREGVLNEQTDHEDKVKEALARKKELIEDARNMGTLALGVRAQTAKKEAFTESCKKAADELSNKLLDIDAKIRKAKADARPRLRELQIEITALRSKVQRELNQQSVLFGEEMGSDADVEIVRENILENVWNPWTPMGHVQRHGVRWCGAHAACEFIEFRPDSSETSSATDAPAFPSRPPAASLKSAGSVAGQPDQRKTYQTVIAANYATPGQNIRTVWSRASSPRLSDSALSLVFDDPQNWEEAAKRELRILNMLRHPHLQEAFTATILSQGLCLVVESHLISLASCLRANTKDGDMVKRTREQERANFSRKLSENESLHISLDLSSALAYLHSKGVAHRNVCAENCFLKQCEDICAKLGGHFAARISCRVAGEPHVPKVDDPHFQGGVRAELRSSSSNLGLGFLSSSIMGKIDARHSDVRAFGMVLLELWKPEITKADLLYKSIPRRMSQLYTEFGPPPDADVLLTIPTPEDAEIIRDASVRLAVARCLEKDKELRPSARAVYQAFIEIQNGDIDEIPKIAGADLSKESRLADVAVDHSDDESP